MQRQKPGRPAKATPNKRGKNAAAAAGGGSPLSLDGALQREAQEPRSTSPAPCADATDPTTLAEQRLAEGCLDSHIPGRSGVAPQALEPHRRLLPDSPAGEQKLRWLEPCDGPPSGSGLPVVPHWTYYSGFMLVRALYFRQSP